MPVEGTIIDVIEEPVPAWLSLLSTKQFGQRLPFRLTASLSLAPVWKTKSANSRVLGDAGRRWLGLVAAEQSRDQTAKIVYVGPA